MSELHEIDGIIFGGERYTVGTSGEVPEGLIDPMDIEWVVDGGPFGGDFRAISPVGNIPIKLPDIDSEGNYITTTTIQNFRPLAKTLTGVILPSHLEEIPSKLFDGGQLEFVEFGDHLTSIGDYAFRNNQLTSLVLPDSVTSIGIHTFRENQLTSLVLPDSLTSIGNHVFINNQLTSVVIPDSVTSIGNFAFRNNPLEEVSIGPNTTYQSTSFPSSAVITVRSEE